MLKIDRILVKGKLGKDVILSGMQVSFDDFAG